MRTFVLFSLALGGLAAMAVDASAFGRRNRGAANQCCPQPQPMMMASSCCGGGMGQMYGQGGMHMMGMHGQANVLQTTDGTYIVRGADGNYYAAPQGMAYGQQWGSPWGTQYGTQWGGWTTQQQPRSIFSGGLFNRGTRNQPTYYPGTIQPAGGYYYPGNVYPAGGYYYPGNVYPAGGYYYPGGVDRFGTPPRVMPGAVIPGTMPPNK